jgi:hypothetical protein
VEDEAYARYVAINLPHARTIAGRIARTVEAMSGSTDLPEGVLRPLDDLERELQDYAEDPALEEALLAADTVANRGRSLVAALLESGLRGDRLGRHIRNLFECLGLAEEGATLSLECGEDPASLLR